MLVNPEAFRPALEAADAFLMRAREAVAAQVAPSGRIDADLLNTHQDGAHGLSWAATYVEVGSSRVDLQACKLEYSIVSPK